ncbi:hypothetical protein [Pseudomonas sp.]|uniref:hypothetical protein n=1 Tax=Pseudomonas sp. TaxID=306 RepID=UPI0028B07431|nr:hypothetical protein [Pseudomonas sp.]
MKNIYGPGFFALLAALVTVSGAMFWATWTKGNNGCTQDAFAFVNSLSALIQALAAGIVAWLAHKGLTSCKQQLIHSKAHGVVWDANVAFRKIDASIERLGLAWMRNVKSESVTTVELAIKKDPIDQQIEDFLQHCHILDKVVLKEDWVWPERAKNLREALLDLAMEVHKPNCTEDMGLKGLLMAKTEQSVEKCVDKLSGLIATIQKDLKYLDKKYTD